MNSKNDAFSNATQGLLELGIPKILPNLHSLGISITRDILGGSHSVVTYPPLHSLLPMDPGKVLQSIHYEREVNLYIHIPFCETPCTFCGYAVIPHYAHRIHGKIVSRYVRALEKEMEFWSKKLNKTGTAIASIYIGGGTPLILEMHNLETLVRGIYAMFEVHSNAPFCIEGSPLSITASDGIEKLNFLNSSGVTSSIISPSLNTFVAILVPIIQGIFNSRETTTAWHIIPPSLVTMAPHFTSTAISDGLVLMETIISP